MVRPERRSDPETTKAANCQRSHKRPLESIAPLTNSSDLADDPFRTVHQLDYATSGVLLLGKNWKAAGTACISFQERRAKKK
jgi:23S rRNA-/tRNA-specific pseudouridylate synthase